MLIYKEVVFKWKRYLNKELSKRNSKIMNKEVI